jgi:hypothetical protein
MAQKGSHRSVDESSDAFAAAAPARFLEVVASSAVLGVTCGPASSRPPVAVAAATCEGHASLESNRAGQKEQACGWIHSPRNANARMQASERSMHRCGGRERDLAAYLALA